MRKLSGKLLYSPSDLIRYVASPYSSWMDRYHLENPGTLTPDPETEDQKLIAETGNAHERSVLSELKVSEAGLVEIATDDYQAAVAATRTAISEKAPIIFQAVLASGEFAGFADFLMLQESGDYWVWDTKLARSPKPYYAVQLCCYSEMLAAIDGCPMPEKFGIILGSNEKVEFRVEDFYHYYQRVKSGFLALQDGFTGEMAECPEPHPRADHGRWTSNADAYFKDVDHLVQVAAISVGQIKKLKAAGVATMANLATSSGATVPKLAAESLEKLAAQARLQCQTRDDRAADPDALPRFELLPSEGENGEAIGLAALPPDHSADVFFDIEGYPLVPGGLEYLLGVCVRTSD